MINDQSWNTLAVKWLILKTFEVPSEMLYPLSFEKSIFSIVKLNKAYITINTTSIAKFFYGIFVL